MANGELARVLDLADQLDRCAAGSGRDLRERALAGLGIDELARMAMQRRAVLEREVAELEAAREFGAPLRRARTELDAIRERVATGIADAGLAITDPIPPSTLRTITLALLLADSGDRAGARARLDAIPPRERAPIVDIHLAMLADLPAAAAIYAARAQLAVEWAGSGRVEPARTTAARGRRKFFHASPDRTLAVWYAEGVELRRLDTGELVHDLGAADVKSAGFSSGGRLVAAGGFDGSIAVYDVATGVELQRFHVPDHLIEDVVFSTRGRVAAVARSPFDRTFDLHVWDLADRRVVARIDKVKESPVLVDDLLLFPTSTALVARAYDGSVRWTLPGTGIMLAEDGRRLARSSGDASEIVTFDLTTGQAEAPQPIALRSVKWLGRDAVIGRDTDGIVHLDLRSGKRTPVSLDAEQGGVAISNTDNTVRYLDPRDLHQIGRPRSEVRLYVGEAIHAHGKRWPIGGGASTPCPVELAGGDPVGRLVALASRKTTDLVDPRTCKVVKTYQQPVLAGWSDGATLVIRDDDKLAIVDTKTGAKVRIDVESERAFVLPDGKLFLGSYREVALVERDGRLAGKGKGDFGTYFPDPRGHGIWIVKDKVLEHRADPLAETATAIRHGVADAKTVVMARSAIRFAIRDEAEITVVGPEHPATTIAVPRDVPFALTPDGRSLVLAHADAIELVDVDTGITSGWLIPRGETGWLRIAGTRMGGTPLAIGEGSALQWRRNEHVLPGWIVRGGER
jgi:hypothetical protein